MVQIPFDVSVFLKVILLQRLGWVGFLFFVFFFGAFIVIIIPKYNLIHQWIPSKSVFIMERNCEKKKNQTLNSVHIN